MDSLVDVLFYALLYKESITTNKCDIVALLLCNTRGWETTISVDYYGEWRDGKQQHILIGIIVLVDYIITHLPLHS